jgi:DNA-binding XRE family transcriptional regulator
MPLTLKKARLISEKTQQEMADAIGVYIDTYRKMEERPEKVSIENAKKIAKFLNMSVNDIFFTE